MGDEATGRSARRMPERRRGGSERVLAGGRLVAGLSQELVAAWRSVFCDVYRWRREGRFAVVPSLLGVPVFAYLPGLEYTDLNAADARELARGMAGRAFNIRALTAGEEPPAGSPAVLRVDLAAFGRDRESVWKHALHATKRRAVRRARKAGLRCGEEAGPAAVATLFRLVSETWVRHGAPLAPAALFEALTRVFEARILVVRGRAGEALASLLWLRDGSLAYLPFLLGVTRSADCPGDLLFWTMMEQALREGADIVDFGRSPVGSGSYRFKRKFGAVPVPVLWLSDRPFDLFRRYAPAQKLWRALPGFVTRSLGPRVRRHLADQ